MNFSRYKYFLIALLLLAGGLTGCQEEEPSSALKVNSGTLEIHLKFAEGHDRSASVRAESGDLDKWTTVAFTAGDELGFYSTKGNADAPNGNGPFYNALMTYKGKSSNNYWVFSTENLNVNLLNADAAGTFMYFPYYPEMGVVLNGEMEPEDATGMPLRESVNITTESGETITQERCVDFMNVVINSGNFSDGIIQGSIFHQFFELVIMREENGGFDQPQAPEGIDPYEVTVVLDQPYSHIRIQKEANKNFLPQLVYLEDETEANIQKYREWKSWRGGNYPNETNGSPASYVLLPVTANQVPSISYIKMWDNNGIQQTVTSFNVTNGNKNLVVGSVLPLTVKMDGLVPSVYPATITSWNGDIILTNKRTRGIHNTTEFIEWNKAYSLYLADPSDNDHKEKLLDFGDYKEGVAGEAGVWHFYLLGDINLKNTDIYINELRDILDGQSTELENSKFLNYTISNYEGESGLIGKLSGSLLNVDFDDFSIVSDTGSPDTSPIGLISNNIENGTLNNCNLTGGYAMVPSLVGVVAGECNGATVTDCSFSAFLIGGNSTLDSFNYLFGKVNEMPQISTTDYFDIIFTPYSLP